jgi:hypothetical protein
MIDEVIITQNQKNGLDFEDDFLRIQPDFLIVTEDDQYGAQKRALCSQVGPHYSILPKTPPKFEPVSTSSIVRWVQAPTRAPRFSRPCEFIVNSAISLLVSLREWPYEKQAGLGGSGAWALLNGRDGFESELEMRVGWQDSAVIRETGLCIWRSGLTPVLDFKHNGDFLTGRMAIRWTGLPHDTPGVANLTRDFDRIAESGRIAREGALHADIHRLAESVNFYHQAQLAKGVDPLPEVSGSLARKYCGGGHGRYSLYLFEEKSTRDAAAANDPDFRAIEPFCRVWVSNHSTNLKGIPIIGLPVAKIATRHTPLKAHEHRALFPKSAPLTFQPITKPQ